MDEITRHIYNLLKSSTAVRTATGISTTPYGVYKQFPEEGSIDFNTKSVITFKFDGDADGGIEGNRLPVSSTYTFTCWGNNYEALDAAIRGALQGQTVNSYESLVKVLYLKWIWTGSEMFDTDLKIYYRPVRYVVKFADI